MDMVSSKKISGEDIVNYLKDYTIEERVNCFVFPETGMELTDEDVLNDLDSRQHSKKLG